MRTVKKIVEKIVVGEIIIIPSKDSLKTGKIVGHPLNLVLDYIMKNKTKQHKLSVNLMNFIN